MEKTFTENLSKSKPSSTLYPLPCDEEEKMKSYYEIKMDEISRKLSILKQQINNHKIIIEKNKGQIANLNAQKENLIQQRKKLLMQYASKEWM